ncbi:hypothetical protein DFH06DRAFT_1229339 [Mycena polygramma]|nr:hypothetical protein DFH06DRAFT_1229339 [Mycena polygramma]
MASVQDSKSVAEPHLSSSAHLRDTSAGSSSTSSPSETRFLLQRIERLEAELAAAKDAGGHKTDVDVGMDREAHVRRLPPGALPVRAWFRGAVRFRFLTPLPVWRRMRWSWIRSTVHRRGRHAQSPRRCISHSADADHAEPRGVRRRVVGNALSRAGRVDSGAARRERWRCCVLLSVRGDAKYMGDGGKGGERRRARSRSAEAAGG